MPSGKKKTHLEFIQELYQINDSIEVIGIYQKNILPIACRCSTCGYEWTPTPKALLKGHGCPKCANCAKLTMKEFVELLKTKNTHFSKIELIGVYCGMSSKIKCKCKICGTEWSPRANDLIRSNTGCPSCSGNITYTHKRFMSDFERKNPNASKIKIVSQYSGMTKRIRCKCNVCDLEWEPVASSLIQGTGCPECAKKRIAEISREQLKTVKRPGKFSHDTFINKFNRLNPYASTIQICSTYNGANSQIKCKCDVCGNEWSTIASGLLSGTGCPLCSHTSTSFMEQFLLKALSITVGDEKVIHRCKNIIGKELDIYLPDFKFAVEIGSWNWHKDVLKSDIQKICECASKNIRLITIYDSYSDDVFLGKDIWTYEIDLASEHNYATLKTIVYRCLELVNVSYEFSNEEWENIIFFAYKNSRRVTNEDFLEKLKNKNPHFKSITIITKYQRSKDKIECECNKCGYRWKTAASELLKGSGCPICQIKAVGERKSKKKLILEWRKMNPNGNKLQCEKETGISRVTIYKWWNSKEK